MGKRASHIQGQPGGAKLPRTRARRRPRACLLLTITGAALGLLSLLPQAPALVWNFTESVPVGLYGVSRTEPSNGDVVAIAPAGAVREVLDAYGALPAGKVLLKQLKAVRGDVVCRTGASVTINGAEAATARPRSRNGRALPAWSGCRALGAGEILVLAPHPLSFDGRYFGPIDKVQIIGVARPLLTFPHEGAS
ncbi:MAG TPA: S26 family signal peptidase [Hyphomonadaceae bacterium]|nr:S26 family signal peptidase [Hyphomonadaceae bacterium]